jgi:chromate reductase, NAD(P)H dehydrogenase (quinone)
MTKHKILGISGSLKSTSSNTRLLKAIAILYKDKIEFELFSGLDEFPYFNPDNENGNDSVIRFKKAIAWADGVLICTPEYAFGVPGVLKNALDWTVHTGDLNDKPTVAVTCSPLYEGGNRCMAALLPTLGALGSKMTETSSLCVGDIYKKLNAENEIINEVLLSEINRTMKNFEGSYLKKLT